MNPEQIKQGLATGLAVLGTVEFAAIRIAHHQQQQQQHQQIESTCKLPPYEQSTKSKP